MTGVTICQSQPEIHKSELIIVLSDKVTATPLCVGASGFKLQEAAETGTYSGRKVKS